MEKKPVIRLERTPGEVVVARRKRLGWTQDELSWRSKVSINQISRIENDACNPKLKTIKKLERALGIPLVDGFMQAANNLDTNEKKYLSPHGSLQDFERKLAKKGLNECELQELLNRVLLEADRVDGEKNNKE